MFSWLTGGDAKLEVPPDAVRPGFHPIMISHDGSSDPSAPLPAPSPPSSGAASSNLRSGAKPSPLLPLKSSIMTSAPIHSPLTASQPLSAEVASETSPLFGGMEVATARRRRRVHRATSSDPAPKAGPSHPLPPPAASHGMEVVDTSPQSGRSAPAAVSPRFRQRLGRFYRFHDPSKMAQLEVILASYVGEESLLFEELIRQYGPEPVGLTASCIAEKAAAIPTAVDAPSAVALQTQSESEISAFAFIGPAAATVGEQCSVDRPYPYETEQSPRGADNEIVVAPSTPSAPHPPLAAAATSDSHLSSSLTPQERLAALAQRHRRELHDAQHPVLEARLAFANTLRAAEDSLLCRRRYFSTICQLEDAIQVSIHDEDYKKADVLSRQLAQVAALVRDADTIWAGIPQRLTDAQHRIEEAVHNVALLSRSFSKEQQREESGLQAQLEPVLQVEDADLQQREGSIISRKNKISSARQAAEEKLNHFRVAEEAIQQRMEKATKAIREQQQFLKDSIGKIEERITILKAELRSAEEEREEKSAQLLHLDEQRKAAEKEHVAELDAAAVAVSRSNLGITDITAQWNELVAQQQCVEAERQERQLRAKELGEQLQQYQQEWEERQRRARFLEEDTLPASGRYWRQWMELLSLRLRGGDVLFAIPGMARADGNVPEPSSAFRRRRDLQRQLEELAGEVAADEELRDDAERRLEECKIRVAPLTAAKSTAVANKNFKEAQRCADELKQLQMKCDLCQSDVELYSGQVQGLQRTEQRLREELKDVEAEAERYASDFKRRYKTILQRFEEEVGHVPDYRLLPSDSEGVDPLADAVQCLWNALQDEWQRASTRAPFIPTAAAAAENAAMPSSSTASSSVVVEHPTDPVDPPQEEKSIRSSVGVDQRRRTPDERAAPFPAQEEQEERIRNRNDVETLSHQNGSFLTEAGTPDATERAKGSSEVYTEG